MSFIIPEITFDRIEQQSPAATTVEAVTQRVEDVSRYFENVFRGMKIMPQCQYFTRPVYKACIKYMDPVAATAVSFLAADLVMHQLLPQAVNCLTSYILPGTDATCAMGWEPWKTAAWMAAALPVMYAKFQRS